MNNTFPCNKCGKDIDYQKGEPFNNTCNECIKYKCAYCREEANKDEYSIKDRLCNNCKSLGRDKAELCINCHTSYALPEYGNAICKKCNDGYDRAMYLKHKELKHSPLYIENKKYRDKKLEHLESIDKSLTLIANCLAYSLNSEEVDNLIKKYENNTILNGHNKEQEEKQ